MKDLIVSNAQLPLIKKSLLAGIEIAAGARSSATLYNKRDEQIAAIKSAVRVMYTVSKEIPLIIACQKGATGFFIQEAVLNELLYTTKSGNCNIVNTIDWYDGGISDAAMKCALNALDRESGITYVLRLFVNLKTDKINNGRSRRLMLDFILSHQNLEFISVKYKNKLQEILRHAYGERMCSILVNIAKTLISTRTFISEKSQSIFNKNFSRYVSGDIINAVKCFLFIFEKGTSDMYDFINFPIMAEYYVLMKDVTKINKVPEEIALGLLSDKKHPQHTAWWGTKEVRMTALAMIREKAKSTTANQVLRQTKKNFSIGAAKTANIERVTDFMALYKTGYETGFDTELNRAIDRLADKQSVRNFPYRIVGILVDESQSMKGHSIESKNTPRAIVDFTSLVIQKSAKAGQVVHVGANEINLLESITELLETEPPVGYDALFILSDGHHDSKKVRLNSIIKAWKNNRSVPVYHVSPILGDDTGVARVQQLGDEIMSISVNKPSVLMTQINAKLLEQDVKKWLEREIQTIYHKNKSTKEIQTA